jgi:hypothetical protein
MPAATVTQEIVQRPRPPGARDLQNVRGEYHILASLLATDGSDPSGNTTKIQALIDAVPAGATIVIPAGRIAHNGLTTRGKHLTFAGQPTNTTTNQAFGGAGWRAPPRRARSWNVPPPAGTGSITTAPARSPRWSCAICC